MPEYFDISFIAQKTAASKSEIEFCLKTVGLLAENNASSLFFGRQMVFSIIDGDEADFEELSIGLLEQVFIKENFLSEMNELSIFVSRFFEGNKNFRYALCSYELNGYLLGNINKIDKIEELTFLKRFPLVFAKKDGALVPMLNLEAQEILAEDAQ